MDCISLNFIWGVAVKDDDDILSKTEINNRLQSHGKYGQIKLSFHYKSCHQFFFEPVKLALKVWSTTLHFVAFVELNQTKSITYP